MSVSDSDLKRAVTEDIRCHRENGVDLNPYSTEGSRRSWEHGFKGQPQKLTDYWLAYRRGALAAQLVNEEVQE